jgi:hypothetical protein
LAAVQLRKKKSDKSEWMALFAGKGFGPKAKLTRASHHKNTLKSGCM